MTIIITARRAFGALAATAIGLGFVVPAQAGEAPATKVFVRWNAFTPQVLAPDASVSTRVLASKTRLQGQLQSVVPGAWVGRTFENVGWSVIAVPAAQKDSALKKLQSAFGAANVEAVRTRHLYKAPNDPSYKSNANQGTGGKWGQWWLPKIGAQQAWDKTTGSSSVIIAVVDTGVTLSHPDLAPNIWKNTGETGKAADNTDKATNEKDDDGNGYVDDVNGFNAVDPGTAPVDDNEGEWHGTHVSGIIGAIGNNAKYVSGVNWNVKILPVKVFDGTGYTEDPTIVQGLEYILALKKRGVNIRALNASWGGPDSSQVLQTAFSKLNAAGILSFVAAGNDGYSIDTKADYPSCYDYATIVPVGASSHDDSRARLLDEQGFEHDAFSSNYGAKNVDIFAPGVEILSLSNDPLPSDESPTAYTRYLDGTSMATPVVTGAAALLWSLKPSYSAAQIKAILLNTVYKAPALKGLCVSNGRLNLASAVSSLSPATPTPKPTATATPKPTSTPKPTATPTPKPTATPIPKPTATPVPATFAITGMVYYRSNGAIVPIKDAQVYLTRKFYSSTDASGNYNAKSLAPGTYVIQVRKGGFSFTDTTVTLMGTPRTYRYNMLGTVTSSTQAVSYRPTRKPKVLFETAS